MSRRITRVAAALVSTAVLLIVAPAVSAAVPILEWTEVDTPGDNDLTVVSPSEVTQIATGDNGLVYAIDSENGRVYRSLEYSLDWEDFTQCLERAGAALPATMIAVAPDNEGIVAVLTDGGTAVYVSLNGGYDWEDVHLPSLSGDVTALAISGEYLVDGDEYREIAVGTASWGDGLSNGEVYILQGGCGWSYWEAQELTVDGTEPIHVGADVATLAYSESYSRDHTLLVVCATGSDANLDPVSQQNKTWLCLGERDKADGGTDWDIFTDYPFELLDVGDAAGMSYLRAMLAIPSDYYSGEEDERGVFVSLEREPDDTYDDVYYVPGDSGDPLVDMNVGGGIGHTDIWSIAYRGDVDGGILLAGDREPVPGELNVQVRRCIEPFDTSPDWETAPVPPTGPGHAYVTWAPNVSLAYCGTSSQPGVALDESAFSASTYGDLWRQMAIIDTEFTLSDLVVTPDGEDLFLTTANEWGPESIWHSYTAPLGERWERVLTIDSVTDAVMIKLSREYEEDETMYVIEHDGTQVALSYDGGDTWDWQRKSPEPILDFIVVDEDTLYAAIPDGEVMVSTNHARSWEDAVDTELDGVNMLSLAPDGTLFVGGSDGYVSYSDDGVESFALLDEDKPVGSGDVQVLADINFEENGWVYAATIEPDEGLWRWKLGSYDDWEQMDCDITFIGDGQRIGGLLLGPEGTLYALRAEQASDDTGGMTRWLCPTCAPCADLEYDHVVEGLPDDAVFECAAEFVTSYPIGTLWGDDVENDVFALDDAGQRIFLFRDTLCKRGPDLETPEDKAHLDLNPCNCNRDAVVPFDWEEFDEVDEYEFKVYLDGSLSEPLWNAYSDYEGIVISPWGDTTDFLSGMRYGWNVRTTEPYLSPWSYVWTFTPTLCPVEDLVPEVGATEVSTSPVFTWDCPGTVDGYEFMLATEPSYAEPIATFSGTTVLADGYWPCNQSLEPNSNYFWRVRAVRGDAIGAWVEGSFRTASVVVESSGVSPAATIDVPAQPSAVRDYFIWAMFALAAVLMAGLIVLILRTGRRY